MNTSLLRAALVGPPLLALVGFALERPQDEARALPDLSELSTLFELELGDAKEIEEAPSSELLDRITELEELDRRSLEGLRRFHAPGAGLHVASLPLPDEGLLLIAVNASGDLQGVALQGSPELDADELDQWKSFQQQFLRGRNACKSIDVEEARTSKQIQRGVEELEKAEGTEAELRRALMRQRMMMREHSFRFSQIGAERKRDVAPDLAWLREWAGRFEELAGLQEDLSEYLGAEHIERTKAAALEGQHQLEKAAELFEAGDSEQAGRVIRRGLYRGSCTSCHKIETEKFESGIYDGTRSDLAARGVPSDYFRVGVDVFPVPGREARSQKIATRIRALLIVLGSA